MLISLHKKTRMTPKIWAAFEKSTEPAWRVAEPHWIFNETVRKWRKRDGFDSRSHKAHQLQTTQAPAQRTVAVSLRKTPLLPLADLPSVVREFPNPCSVLDHCLRRYRVGNLRDMKPTVPRSAYGAYEPGHLHAEVKYLPQMADEDRCRYLYLYLDIDRAKRWVFVRIHTAKTATNGRRFLRDLEQAAPMKIGQVLTNNGKKLTDRFGLRKRAATSNHDFDRLCAELDIEHRLASPMHTQTNGMAKGFNGRIEDVQKRHPFQSEEDLEQTILRYVRLYNGQIAQPALKGRTLIDALEAWWRQKPQIVTKRVSKLAGCDT